MKENIYIIGGGTLSEFVIDILERKGQKPLGIFDDTKAIGDTVLDVPVVGSFKDAENEKYNVLVCGIGDPKFRQKVMGGLSNKTFPSIIDETAIVSSYSSISSGCIIGPYTSVLAGSKIGFGSCILAHSNVNQNVIIGSFVLIGAACTIGNNAAIGDGSHIGLGVNIKLGEQIKAWDYIES